MSLNLYYQEQYTYHFLAFGTGKIILHIIRCLFFCSAEERFEKDKILTNRSIDRHTKREDKRQVIVLHPKDS
jgi:hypothetical protein